MKKQLTHIGLLGLMFLMGCNTDEKPALTLLEEIEYGAVIRTLSFNNGEFELNDLNSLFSVNIEEQDKENGGLFEALDVFVRFVDNTSEGGNLSTGETLVETLAPDTFEDGPAPEKWLRKTLEYSFSQLLEATGIQHASVNCKDQFIIRLAVKLTDGRTFTEGNSNALISAFDTFFSSPYEYTINVVEPIDEALFTGTYSYESIVDGPLGPTFLSPNPVVIFRGHSNNVRRVLLWHVLSHKQLEADRFFNFSIVCDEIVMGKHQLTSVEGNCGLGNGVSGTGDLILIGPGEVNAIINPNDDSVFEIEFVEGFNGWDGDCGFGTARSRIRFTKQ